jgi:hypothetical protein
MHLMPSLLLDPPPRYVAFVAVHLEPLRRESFEALGDDTDARRLYPEVLTDVARRWSWLELARAVLRRPEAAEGYLRRSLHRRTQQARARWEPEEDGSAPQIEFVVWRSKAPRPAFSSGATRLAPHLHPAPRTEFGVVAEAAVAWWHAYEAHRRNRYIALAVVVLVLLGLLFQAPTS